MIYGTSASSVTASEAFRQDKSLADYPTIAHPSHTYTHSHTHSHIHTPPTPFLIHPTLQHTPPSSHTGRRSRTSSTSSSSGVSAAAATPGRTGTYTQRFQFDRTVTRLSVFILSGYTSISIGRYTSVDILSTFFHWTLYICRYFIHIFPLDVPHLSIFYPHFSIGRYTSVDILSTFFHWTLHICRYSIHIFPLDVTHLSIFYPHFSIGRYTSVDIPSTIFHWTLHICR